MLQRTRTLILGASLALGLWLIASAENTSADDKKGESGSIKETILKIADGKAASKDAETLASKADLEDVMRLFKPRSKGGLGMGATADAIKPDGIEPKFIDLGKSKKGLSKAELGKQGPAIAKAAEVTKAIADVTLFYTDKPGGGKKDPTKWKTYTTSMHESAEELAKAAKSSDADGIKKAANKVNASCNDCHGVFRDN